MTTLTPTSPPAVAMAELSDLIAGCAEFQEECKAEADPDETSKSFVHFPLQENDTPEKFPFAILTHGDTSRVRQADGTHLPRGVIRLLLGKKIPPVHDAKMEELAYANFEGAIINDIETVSGTGGHFVWTATQVGPPAKTDARNMAAGDAATPAYYESMWDLEWSPL